MNVRLWLLCYCVSTTRKIPSLSKHKSIFFWIEIILHTDIKIAYWITLSTGVYIPEYSIWSNDERRNVESVYWPLYSSRNVNKYLGNEQGRRKIDFFLSFSLICYPSNVGKPWFVTSFSKIGQKYTLLFWGNFVTL